MTIRYLSNEHLKKGIDFRIRSTEFTSRRTCPGEVQVKFACLRVWGSSPCANCCWCWISQTSGKYPCRLFFSSYAQECNSHSWVLVGSDLLVQNRDWDWWMQVMPRASLGERCYSREFREPLGHLRRCKMQLFSNIGSHSEGLTLLNFSLSASDFTNWESWRDYW